MIRTILTLVAALLLFAQPVFANMAAPWRDGQIGSEPSGIPGVHVVHEDLQFALIRGDNERLASDRITAIYKLRNEGPALSSPLQFVAVGITDAAGISVRVNGEEVPVTLHMSHPIPPEWGLPERAPAPGGGETYVGRFQGETAPSILFDVELDPGENEIAVRYEARPRSDWGEPLWEWQTAYVLSPAKGWESFGTLDVSVTFPGEYAVASSLPLEASDRGLSGSFKGVPADAIVLTMRRDLSDASLALLVVLLVAGGILLGWLLPFVLVKRWTHPAFAGLVGIPIAVFGGIAGFFSTGLFVGPGFAGWDGYFLLFIGFPLIVVSALLFGVVATIAAGARSHGKELG